MRKKLSKRAASLLERVRDQRRYYPFKGDPTGAMKELVDKGYVGTMGRAVKFVLCWCPVGARSNTVEKYPTKRR